MSRTSFRSPSPHPGNRAAGARSRTESESGRNCRVRRRGSVAFRSADRSTAVDREFRTDDRGVSTTLGYVLSLAIASVLISGLMIAAGGYVQSEREQVVRSELNVIGETLIADLEGADRLASSIDGEVTVRSSLPRRVGSSAYTIQLRSDAYDGISHDATREMVLSADAVDVSVQFRVVTNTRLDADGATVDGGELVIEYDSGTDELEVTDA